MVEGVEQGVQARGPSGLRDRILGFVIVVVAFLGSLGVSFWAKQRAVAGRGPTAEESASRLPGWPREVDPIRLLGNARALSEWNGLRSIVASGVRTGGTVDVTDTGRVRYVFEGSPRPSIRGAGGTRRDAGQLVCPSQTVRIEPGGLRAGTRQKDARCPASRRPTLPEPRCDMAQIWRLARNAGAQPDLAEIDYSYGDAGPRWRFRTTRQNQSYEFSADCRRRVDAPTSLHSLK